MKNYTNFVIFKGLKLILEYYYGAIYLEDFLRMHQARADNEDYEPNFNLLIDFREAEIIMSKKDIIELEQFHKNNPRLFGKRHAAHITNTPKQVVAGTMFDSVNRELPIQIKIFSTLEASLKWVEVPVEKKDIIESYIQKFKKESENANGI